jgi:diguanylate cyclase (GGDEF)-like protein
MVSASLTDFWTRYLNPAPILQWLVVMVLAAQVIINAPSPLLLTSPATLFTLGLVFGNHGLLTLLPRFAGWPTTTSVLVVLDTVLVPVTLYATGLTSADLFVAYFGIIMMAGASGSVKRTLILSLLAWCTYAAFTLSMEGSLWHGNVLLSLPFFLVVTLFYGGLAELVHRERAERERLAHVALHDELTDLPNRRLIMESLTRALSESIRFNSPMSCVVLDLDGFKHANDVYGHSMGDQVLRDVAAMLTAEKRGYDLAGRLGGDEFVWVLPRADEEGAMAAAERFREAVAQFQFGKKEAPFHLTTSVGITTFVPGLMPEPSPKEMLRAADVALYAAKKGGGNQIRVAPWERVAGSPWWDSSENLPQVRVQRRDSGGGQSMSACLPQKKQANR